MGMGVGMGMCVLVGMYMDVGIVVGTRMGMTHGMAAHTTWQGKATPGRARQGGELSRPCTACQCNA